MVASHAAHIIQTLPQTQCFIIMRHICCVRSIHTILTWYHYVELSFSEKDRIQATTSNHSYESLPGKTSHNESTVLAYVEWYVASALPQLLIK